MFVGLGLMVGAVLQPASAQQRDSVARRDSIARQDSIAKADSTHRADSTAAVRRARLDSLARRDSIRRADSIKAGISQAELPVLADPAGSFHLTRKEIFSTGAVTLMDLLERVPGLTGLRANWIAEPQMASYLGDFRRVRVYLDGFALEEMDPHMNRVWDLSQIQLWALDDLLVERTASEIRIHMRTWRVERTTPFSRTDIYTGDQATNLYRGLLGRRFQHGEVLQLAGQQYGTSPSRNSSSNDQLGIFARFGIARRKWTADAVLLRVGRHRGSLLTLTGSDSVQSTESKRYDAYARLAWQDTSTGWWAQALAGASTYGYHTPTTTTGAVTDTGKSRSQYVFTGGYARGPWHGSFTQRFLLGGARHTATPSVRGAFETRFLTVSGSAEGRGLDSTRRFDVSGVIRPTSFLFVSGAFSGEQPFSKVVEAPLFSRVETGIRLKDTWLSVGVVHRDKIELDPTRVLLEKTPLAVDSAATGAFATLRGRVWKAIYLDVNATRWNDTAGLYRPQYQTRSELYLNTSWLSHFPSGNFHIRASVTHEYRSTLYWPDTIGVRRVPGFRTISTLLQFKIVSAELFWNYRNEFDERYAQIPGFRMPRLANIYGVRWEFWN